MRRAIGFDLSYLSTSKASPNDLGIVVIVIIIVIGEVVAVAHDGGIIAQSLGLERPGKQNQACVKNEPERPFRLQAC